MSSSPFDAVTSGLTSLVGSITTLSAPRLHPMDGKTADAANDSAQRMSYAAIQTEDWARELMTPAQEQSKLDQKVSACMTPAALDEWKSRCARMTDKSAQMTEIHEMLAESKKRREALLEHAAGTFSSLPDIPETAKCSPQSGDGAGGADGTGKPKSDAGLNGEGVDDETEPETAPEAVSTSPTPMASDAPETSTPTVTADTAAHTELSSSTMTSDPAARAALSGQMAQGQGTPQVGQPSPMTTGPTGGAAAQLSPNQAPARGGTSPRSPEKRREDRDRQADKDATVQAAAAVTMGAAGGAIGASATMSPGSSPTTAPSGSSTAPTATPSTPPSNAAPGSQGAGGAGMGGMARGSTLGSGNTVNAKPVVAADQPLTAAEIERLLTDTKGDKK